MQGPEMLRAVCATCRRSLNHYELSTWFVHIWDLFLWQEGKYPFSPNDLSPAEWRSLGILRRELAEIEREGERDMLMAALYPSRH